MATTVALEQPIAQAEQEQAQATQEIFKIVSGYWLSRSVQVAAALGIPDLVDAEGVSVDELARQSGTDASSLYRLLRGLASFGIFRELDGRRFSSTPTSNVLRSDVRGSLRSAVISELGRVHYQSWGHLIDSVRTGEIAFDRVYGTDVWDYFDQNPAVAETFNDSMTRITEAVQQEVLRVYDFSRYESIVDVGGGQGQLLASILDANPAARGTLIDRAQVIEQARKLLADHPAADRIALVAADFFESVPAGGDLYVLKWIIHDWAEAQALTILRNVRRAMTPGARVLLLETVLPEANTPHFAPMMDLNMLVMTGGRERRASEYGELLAKAGLRLLNVHPTESPVSIIEAQAL